MKKLCRVLPVLTALLVWVPIAQAGLPFYYTLVSASQTNSTVTVSLPATSDQAFTVTLANDGPKDVYVTTNGATATTSDMQIKPGESIVFHSKGGFGINKLGVICATGDTASVRILAFPTQ